MTPFDVAVRHQAYIEGVKNYEREQFDPTLEALVLLLGGLLASFGYARVSDMPKKVLRDFVSKFNKKAASSLEKFNNSFTKELKEIAKIDALIASANFAALTGLAAINPGNADTWDKISNDIIPASGHMPKALLADFLRSARNQFGLLIKRAYSEKWSSAELLKAVNGTKAKNYKDGLLNKLKNQFNTVQQTLIQHIRQWINYTFGSYFYDAYQWVSVLDSQTTDICRSRNGNIYQYGIGPRPPAHYNCRSTIVGLKGVTAYSGASSFFRWIKDQPLQIQNDLLGLKQAQKLRAGKLTPADLPRFDGTKKLKPSEYLNKQANMLL